MVRGMDLQDSFPGCMGKMINLFDLSAGMARTKLLTERPHREVVRNCSDVVREPIYPVEAKIQGKQIVSEQRSSYPNKKSGGTPIKMLISQEMWGDTESRQKPPSVVARLMGLDSLPVQQSIISDRKSRNKGFPCNSLTGEVGHYQQQEGDHVDDSMECESQCFTHEKKVFRDVYEVRQQPSKNVCVKEQSPKKARCYESSYHQRRMALVEQKFIEAKRLAIDEKLIDSKEFQDAVEVLNSNRDLFIKFLEEPNSLLTKHLFELESMPPSSQKTHITVLKPKGDKSSMERQLLTDSVERAGKANNKHYWTSGFSEPKLQNLSQPTRIVVLKPSPGKPDDINATLPNNSPTLLGGRVSSGGGALATDELVGSREVAKEITRQMRESLSSNRDEALLSSVVSNGYIGDESSFNRSESEYVEGEVGSSSNSEIATPATEYSWHYINNKIGSPLSASSCTRASHSPESSVIREAKKRLSERLALVASNESSQEEQRQLQRSSSTLGEMLAIPELKKEEGSKEEFTLSSSKSSNGGEDDPKVASAFLSTFGIKDEQSGENSHRNLSRSKSAPLSSSACEVGELNVGISSSLIGKPIVQTEILKSNSGRSSFKDKVSSFFFSRSKKPSAEKPSTSPDDRVQSGNSDGSGTINDVLSQSFIDTLLAQTKLVSPHKLHDGSAEGIPFPKGGHSLLWKPGISGNFTQDQDQDQDQDQSSQIPVLEAALVDDVNNGLSRSSGSIIAERPQALSRSPLIESVARSLSWGASYLDTASAKPLKTSMIFSKADREHQQFVFVQRLISSAGIDNKKSMIFGRWHSLDSPLNPSLLYESLHMDEEEGKCREWGSSCRLLFDAVNEALLDISQAALFDVYPWTSRACHGTQKDGTPGASAVAQVWAIVRNGLTGDKCVPSDSTCSSMVVERSVKKEVAGRRWGESRWLEVCEFSEEVGGKVLEELVEEALSELSN